MYLNHQGPAKNALKVLLRDFPGGPMVKNLPCNAARKKWSLGTPVLYFKNILYIFYGLFCNFFPTVFVSFIYFLLSYLLPYYFSLQLCLAFPGGSDGKASAYNAGDPGSIPGSGRSPGEGNGNPLQDARWKIPWMEEPGRLQSMGSQRVRHDWGTSLSFFL